jgi:hypothetical protein
MNHGDTTLVEHLRAEIGKAIDRDIENLIITPTDRYAGRIEALRQVLGLVDGTYAKLNDIRPNQNPEK